MDGGAMGTYDAYAQDVPLCVTFDGFHKSIPQLDYCFDNKQTFFDEMDKIVTSHYNRLEFFKTNNPHNYVEWIIGVWKGNEKNILLEKDKQCISYNTVVEKKREQYYDLVLKKFRLYLSQRLARVRFENLLKK